MTAKIVELPLDRHTKLKNFVLANLRYLDEGCFATVYESPSRKHKYIVKTGSTDDPYLNYAKAIVKKQKPNPFLPKITKILIVGDVYYVVMEKLRGAPDVYVDSISDLFDINNIINKGRDEAQLRSAIRLIKRVLKERPMSNLDLHSSNVMIRGRKQLVITDPLC